MKAQLNCGEAYNALDSCKKELEKYYLQFKKWFKKIIQLFCILLPRR
jgi:hypothetical protein